MENKEQKFKLSLVLSSVCFALIAIFNVMLIVEIALDDPLITSTFRTMFVQQLMSDLFLASALLSFLAVLFYNKDGRGKKLLAATFVLQAVAALISVTATSLASRLFTTLLNVSLLGLWIVNTIFLLMNKSNKATLILLIVTMILQLLNYAVAIFVYPLNNIEGAIALEEPILYYTAAKSFLQNAFCLLTTLAVTLFAIKLPYAHAQKQIDAAEQDDKQ